MMVERQSFSEVVGRFIQHGTNEAADALIDAARQGLLGDVELAHLARRLAESGEMLSFPELTTSDIASTGGPSSLSTILCPLFLAHLGHTVVKLGIPGRPAGGIDILAQVPGYRFILSAPEVRKVLEECGFAHFLAAEDFAPRDGQLYQRRKEVNAVDIPSLAVSSLLSKKLAVGLTRVGLEVRVADHGNFGRTWMEAEQNARCFNRVATLLGIQSRCFLTDGRRPYQPFIGRGEALLALKDLLAERENEDLVRHAQICFLMARGIAADASEVTMPSSDRMSEVLDRHLRAQGASLEALLDAAERIDSQPRWELTAPESGFVHIDLGRVRSALVALQSDSYNVTQFPDSAGLILRCETGEYVVNGRVIASARCENASREKLQQKLIQGFTFSNSPGESAGFQEVSHG